MSGNCQGDQLHLPHASVLPASPWSLPIPISNSALNLPGPLTSDSRRFLWYRPSQSDTTSFPIKSLRHTSSSRGSPCKPTSCLLPPHCPSPAPRRRECLEGPHCNAEEVAVETRQDGTLLREAKCPMFLARQKRGVRDVEPPPSPDRR